MKYIDIIRMCLRNLTKRKIRTLLTVSGVLIGTSAIIVMISLGIGMQNAMDQMLSQWADLTMIEVYRWNDVNEKGEEIPKLDDDVLEGWMQLNHVKGVTPIYQPNWNSVMIYAEDIVYQTSLIGVYMDQLENFGYELKEGEFKKPTDPEYTIILGENALSYGTNYETGEWEYAEYDYETEQQLPFRIDPMTAEIHIAPAMVAENEWGGYDIDYSTIGSKTAPNMEYDEIVKVAGKLVGSWRDHYTMEGVFIDIAYASKLNDLFNELNPDYAYAQSGSTTDKITYTNVKIRVDDMKNVVAVEDSIKEMGYQTYSASQMREEMKNQTQLIQLVLGALAAVSLFVAALNIANTMIMSIIERTREIGIMKVLGCDVGKICLLFLSEAGALGFIGGASGVVISYILSYIINTFLSSDILGMLGANTDASVITVNISAIEPWLILLGLAFATFVGLISGFYPAYRSVKISALEAIRHE